MWLADEDTNSILTDNTNRAGKKVDKCPPPPLPRDLSEHIPLIVTTNIRITTLLCRCNNKYLDIIWKLHCYNLSALLQQLCVEIILLQLLNVVTVFITTYSLNVVTMEYFIVTITITSFTHAHLSINQIRVGIRGKRR